MIRSRESRNEFIWFARDSRLFRQSIWSLNLMSWPRKGFLQSLRLILLLQQERQSIWFTSPRCLFLRSIWSANLVSWVEDNAFQDRGAELQ
jgi:hypothetical protein